MPCNDAFPSNYDYELERRHEERKARLDAATRAACEAADEAMQALRKLNARNLGLADPTSPETAACGQQHQLEDAELGGDDTE